MTSKAGRRKDILDTIGNVKKQQRTNNGLSRQNFSGLASGDFGSVAGNSSGGSSSTNAYLSGDNLGDHVATQNLNLVNFDLIGANSIQFYTTGQTITDDANGMRFSLPDATDTYDFSIDGNQSISMEKFFLNLTNTRIQMLEEAAPSAPVALNHYVYVDSTSHHLTIKHNGSTFDLESGSSGAGLADNNVWTGSNTFQGIVSMTGASITLGDASTDIINFGGKAGTDLNMGTYDITNLDNISFGAGTQNIADTTTPVSNLYVKTVRLQSGSLITNKPSITSSGGSSFDLNFPTGSNFTIYEQSQAKHTFSGSSLTTPNILSSGTWTLTSDTNSPNTNGMFARVGGHVKVYTGGALKSLSDIGTGSGGASLSGTNVWTGSNTFQSAVSMTGASVIIGNASSDQLYINSTMQSDLDMGDNDLTDVQSVRFGAVGLSPLNGTLWYDGSNLKGKSSGGGTFTIDGSGGSSGPTLTSTNTWTGVNTFTSTTSFSVTSPNIYIGDQATDDIDITGEVSIQGGDLTVHNNLQVYNNVVINDALTVHDNVTLGSSSSDTVEVNGDINLNSDVNFTNNTGTASYNFYSLYSQGYITIKINGSNKRLYYFAG